MKLNKLEVKPAGTKEVALLIALFFGQSYCYVQRNMGPGSHLRAQEDKKMCLKGASVVLVLSSASPNPQAPKS